MPVLKIKKDGVWEEVRGSSPIDGGNADTLDGRHADEFALYEDVDNGFSNVQDNFNTLDTNLNDAFGYIFNEFNSVYDGLDYLYERVGDESVSDQIDNALANFSGAGTGSSKTLTQHLTEEDMVLSSRQYGDTLPEPGIPGRIFFLRTQL